jgi:integrase
MTRRSEFGAIDQPLTRAGKPGRWRARYKDNAGSEHVARFDTKKAAGEWLASQRVGMARGEWTDPRAGRITLTEWTARYVTSEVGLRPSTRSRDERYRNIYILPTLGHVELGKLDYMTVRSWVAALSAQGLAPATVVKASQILSKILSAAVDAKVIPVNPAANVDLPTVERTEMMFVQPADIEALASAMVRQRNPHNHLAGAGPDYGPLVVTGCYSGLRVGELFALTGADVDLLHRAITVRRIVTEVDGRLFHGPPKTDAGRRTVPIPQRVVDAVAPLMGAADALIFPASEGGYVRLNGWRARYWKPATAAAGLAGMRPHDMRHTAISLWLAAGADVKEIAQWAGHASVATVLDRYGHVKPGGGASVMASLDRGYSEAVLQPNPLARIAGITG